MNEIKNALSDDMKLYTVNEVAEILRVCKRSVYTYITEGRLKAVKAGRGWKVSETNLKAYINGEPQK